MKVTQTHQVTKSQNVLLGEISSFLCLVADRDPNAQIIVGGRSVAISTQGQFVYVPTLERHPKAFLAASMDSNNLYDANADLITGGVIMQEVAIDLVTRYSYRPTPLAFAVSRSHHQRNLRCFHDSTGG